MNPECRTRWSMPLVFAALVILSGFAIGPVIYKPNAPVATAPVFPWRVTVPPFVDATQDPPHRNKTLMIPLVVLDDRHWFNVTKAGNSSTAFSPNARGKRLPRSCRPRAF